MIKTGPAFSDFMISDSHNSSFHSKGRRERSSAPNPLFAKLAPLFLLIMMSAILLLRLFYIQILRGDYYKGLSDSNRIKTKLIEAPRGIIYDMKGRPLVRNSPAFKIIENKKAVFISNEDALQRISENKEVKNDVMRDYLYKDAFTHVLGYVGQISENEIMLPKFKGYGVSDFNGKMGLEKQYENILRGKSGRELYESDAQGRIIRFLGKDEAIAGRDIRTTLNLELQLEAMSSMKSASRGAVVVSDPRDGSIRALYSKPSFDSNLFTKPLGYEGVGDFKKLSDVLTNNNGQPFLNRAIAGTYPPGSTFKLITAIAALEKGAFTASTQIEDTGILKIGSFSFGNWYFLEYGKKDGSVDMVKAIKRSNDIYFYKAAEAAGVDGVVSWSRSFGVGEKTGIDIPGEAKGNLPSQEWKKKVFGEPWYLGDTYHLGIGQGFLLTTPLQVNLWTIPFANNGELYRPHILEEKKQVLRKNFIKKEYRDLIRRGMKESCEEGGVAFSFFNFKIKNDSLRKNLTTGKQGESQDYTEESSGSAKMVRVKVGCKTGTAETDAQNSPHAWITVFAPFYNPEIVVTVLVENGGQGSSVAGPIAEKVLRKYFEEKGN